VVWSVASALAARVVSAYVLYVFFEATLYGMIALVAAQLARRSVNIDARTLSPCRGWAGGTYPHEACA
jgi:hypothetical protein